MRLKHIKLAGFKSFVDPTTVSLHSNLTSIVGPNGCGKSNIVDAVRWLMGESSARQLRGEALTDVIFTGSGSRKPVAQASVELIFDNSAGRLGGQYAQVAELSVRRQVGRDTQSVYSINGTRCRRRDVLDIFLGTGLGPRSYAIIEQGMISSLVEAKPDELRNYLEEAAGISLYRERRRETENRIRHTRDNMDRLDDLREELGRQIRKLKRQSGAAEKYRQHKSEERQLKAELIALRWQARNAELEAGTRSVNQQELRREQVQTRLQSILTRTDQQRLLLDERKEQSGRTGQRLYALGSDIARLEESLRVRQQQGDQIQADMGRTAEQKADIARQLDRDAGQIKELAAALETVQPQHVAAQQDAEDAATALQQTEARLADWQQEWDLLTRQEARPREQVEVETSRIAQLEQSLQRIGERLQRLAADATRISSADEHVQGVSALDQHLQKLEPLIRSTEQELAECQQQLGRLRDELVGSEQQLAQAEQVRQQLSGRRASLEALQEAALGQTDEAVRAFLGQHGLADNPRLAQRIQVEPGWEQAVESVLGAALRAVVVHGLAAAVIEDAGALKDAELMLFDSGAEHAGAVAELPGARHISELVTSGEDLSSLLGDTWVVQHLHEALKLRDRLPDGGCIVTREGARVGRNWLRLDIGDVTSAGVLHRRYQLEALDAELAQAVAAAEACGKALEQQRQQLSSVEETRQRGQEKLAELNRELVSVRTEHSGLTARLEEIKAQGQRIDRERSELLVQQQEAQQQLAEARNTLAAAGQQSGEFARQRDHLKQRRDALHSQLEAARQAAADTRNHAHALALREQQHAQQLAAVRKAHQRLESQNQEALAQEQRLGSMLEESRQPIAGMRDELQEALKRRLQVEAELEESRRLQADAEEALQGLGKQRSEVEGDLQSVQAELGQAREQRKEVEVRRHMLEQQLAELGHDAAALLAALDADADEERWGEKLGKVEARIARLGPINLAAIEEYNEQLERKEYLDAQFADLDEALSTLTDAINKIDRETRSRFQEAFDKVNGKLGEVFPRMFGGGRANLVMTGSDLLSAGVTVMAHPPGKRNASVNLLSGGEKALVAISLVFAFFQLNPSPFCILDEVDAPLDDANVERYCRLAKEMAEEIQLVYVTHNKIAMEMGEQLIGVTMQEPGVSRLVSVDVEQAAAMASG